MRLDGEIYICDVKSLSILAHLDLFWERLSAVSLDVWSRSHCTVLYRLRAQGGSPGAGVCTLGQRQRQLPTAVSVTRDGWLWLARALFWSMWGSGRRPSDNWQKVAGGQYSWQSTGTALRQLPRTGAHGQHRVRCRSTRLMFCFFVGSLPLWAVDPNPSPRTLLPRGVTGAAVEGSWEGALSARREKNTHCFSAVWGGALRAPESNRGPTSAPARRWAYESRPDAPP